MNPELLLKRTNKIAVTIITGFLGAGKTTFINCLLKQHRETRFALVENEFGEVSIDTKLVKGVDASQMFELKQGCICCTISDEFELVLQELADRFPNVGHLLIETTGIADPAPVIRPFFADENLKEIYKYNGTICLVDAINFGNSPEKEIKTKQVVIAEIILISKSGYLSEIQKAEFMANIRKFNPYAEIQFLGLSQWPDIQIKSILQKQKTGFNFTVFSSTNPKISTKTFRYSQPLNKEDFTRWLSYTLDIYKNEIYRLKGIVSFENEPYEYILQGVGGSFELSEGDKLNLQSESLIVFIGKNLTGIRFD